MAKTRLHRVHDLQRQIEDLREQIRAEQAACDHRLVVVGSPRPSTELLTPVPDVYFLRYADHSRVRQHLSFQLRCTRCDLLKEVTDKKVCPLCQKPMKEESIGLPRPLQYGCWPNKSSDWHFEHLFGGVICTSADCHYARVYCWERNLAHY